MRTKIFAILIIIALGFCSKVYSDEIKIIDVVKDIPLKQGIAFSLEDSELNYLSTIEIAKWKNITLEAGYAGAAEETEHKIVGVLSYPLLKLSDYIEIPILNLLELNLGVYGGYGRVNLVDSGDNDNEWDYGVSATLINLKF